MVGVMICITIGALLVREHYQIKKANRYAEWIMQLRNGKKK